jgi:hypothetical protein
MPETISDPPPVRTGLTPAPVVEALQALPVVDFQPDPPVVEAEVAPPPPAGRATQRLIRRMRWRLHKPRRRLALLTLAAGAALAWFSPGTRGPTRAAWHRAGTQMQIMFDRVLPSSEAHP